MTTDDKALQQQQSQEPATIDGNREMLLKALDEMGWTPVRLHLLKRVLPEGIPLAEVVAYLHRCEQWGLDPLNTEQISVQPRMSKATGEVKYTYIPGIAGRRMLAARTGNYAPGDITRYEYDADGALFRAVASVRIYHAQSNTWFLVEEEARWSEYVQTYWDKETKTRKPSGLWATHPTVMLGKTAETRVLRKAFPEIFEGVYAETEFDHIESDPTPRQVVPQRSLTDHAARALGRRNTSKGLPAMVQPVAQAEPPTDAVVTNVTDKQDPDPLNSTPISGD